MERAVGLNVGSCADSSWWVFTLPAFLGAERLCSDGLLLLVSLVVGILLAALLTWGLTPGGPAWAHGRARAGPNPIPGPRGLPLLGSLLTLSSGLPHRALTAMSRAAGPAASQLMAFSIGATPAVVSSDPAVARELLSHPHLADRPLKRSARELMFARAMGFAPSGPHWRLLRRVASSHLFCPRLVAAHEPHRQADCAAMLHAVAAEQAANGKVGLRPHLQAAALNNIMGSVFGKRYDVAQECDEKAAEIKSMVREGFDLLGAFNWSDHLPWLGALYDPRRVTQRCAALVPRVRRLVRTIIDEHRAARVVANRRSDTMAPVTASLDGTDFVDVLLSMGGDEKLDEDDMVAVLWVRPLRNVPSILVNYLIIVLGFFTSHLINNLNLIAQLLSRISNFVANRPMPFQWQEMIFRGTDTTALLTEWAVAELVLHPAAQARLRAELESVTRPGGAISDADAAKLPYLQAVIKETLRLHPPGPLLSWARLSTSDVQLGNGMVVPAGTTAMVNMWAITHDPAVWDRPAKFRPERFLAREGGEDVDVRGGDLRLAPFGAGRRVCPGKNLALATVGLWVARLVHRFEWGPTGDEPVDLAEVLKLSLEMKKPLVAVATARTVAA
ncbi:hypothetical protein Taro_033345 [Colocasia esculenta]|uniref:Cytochrome P450 n=1 Tax=Colocasia esculenta TaxID=4460 RepID=A0A843VZW9_COLES|nr:hypothetical protein [Colocasia esculenta]